MAQGFQVVPTVARLELENVGPWRRAELEFAPGLNIITTEPGGAGVTTILRAIMQAVCPLAQPWTPLQPTSGTPTGKVMLEFYDPRIACQIPTASDLEPSGKTTAEQMLAKLESLVLQTPHGMALLMDTQVTSCLDAEAYRRAAVLINGARCQVILGLHHRLDAGGFVNARIFTCRSDGRIEVER